MGAQPGYWIAAGVAILIIVGAALAERRRARRRDLDAIGWAPWRGIQVAAMFALALIVILAARR